MSQPFTFNKDYSLPLVLSVLFAIAIQFQITLFQSDNYLGLRINAADALTPFVGIAILIHLLRNKSQWPQWRLPRPYIWLTLLSLTLIAALFNTYFIFGEISRWALINKVGGWAVLMGLLGIGGWLGTNASLNHVKGFIQAFLYVALAIAFLEIVTSLIEGHLWIEGLLENTYFPIEGYMANRNAYALFFTAVFCISLTLYFSQSRVMPMWYYIAAMLLSPALIALNNSRAMMIALGISFLFILATNIKKNTRKSLLCLTTLTVGFLILAQLLPYGFSSFSNKFHFLGQIENISSFSKYDPSKLQYPGDSMRLTILEDARDLVSIRPVTGSGLGSVFYYQEQKHGQMINLIDNTPLWLLVETGAIGLLIFLAFYIICAKTLFNGWKASSGDIKSIQLGILYTMICFTVMCLFHEIMYTRFVWVLLGIGLTLPFRMHQSAQTV